MYYSHLGVAGYGARIYLVNGDPAVHDLSILSHAFLKEKSMWGGHDKRIEAPTLECPDRVFLGYEFGEEAYQECLAVLRKVFGEPMTKEQMIAIKG